MAGVTVHSVDFIYSQETAQDFLQSVGFDTLEDAKMVFCLALNIDPQDLADLQSGTLKRSDDIDDWECVADGYLQAYNNLCERVDDELDKFVNGRKKTKAQFASWLKFIMEDALYEY